MAAVQMGAASIAAGMDRVVIVGGVESLSHMPRFMKSSIPPDGQYHPWMPASHPDRIDAPNLNMSITVGENTARAAGIDRPTLDAWAYRSHQRAIAAIDEGRFVDEIFPIEVPGRDGTPMTFAVDEHPRRTTTLEKLAALPVLNPNLEGAVVTAGSASGINDGACALVLADERWAAERGLKPLGAIRAWASVGVDPADTGLGPVFAIPKALSRAGLGVRDIDLMEINEAFASVPIAACRRLELDEDRVNVSGSGCSLGHPVGATGARMIVTTLFELRRRGRRHGLASLCAGGGMGSAIVFEAR
jgi:acetyl-CoA C-acetyltransferase